MKRPAQTDVELLEKLVLGHLPIEEVERLAAGGRPGRGRWRMKTKRGAQVDPPNRAVSEPSRAGRHGRGFSGPGSRP